MRSQGQRGACRRAKRVVKLSVVIVVREIYRVMVLANRRTTNCKREALRRCPNVVNAERVIFEIREAQVGLMPLMQ